MTHHVLWVIPVAELGGVARHALDAASNGLPGYRMTVLCPEGPLAAALRGLNVPVIAAAIGPDAGMRASVAAVRRAVRTLRPDVVHSHLAYADVATVMALRSVPGRRGPAVVTTEHGISGTRGLYHSSPRMARARRAAHTARLARTDLLIAVAQSTADQVRRQWHPRCPVRVILNGAPTPRSPSPRPDDGRLRVLSLSRLSHEKRLESLLRAVERLRARHPDIHVTLAGTGPEEAQVRGLVTRLGLDDVVTMPGHVSADGAMAEADVLVQLSAWENCSYSILDAAAHGLGVVATPVGGNPGILPERCMVAADDAEAVASAVLVQGRDLDARPGLPQGWPSVADMCSEISEAYDATLGRAR